MDALELLEDVEDELRAHFLCYTRRAYALLPEMTRPRILDIGCGSGIVTVELARLSGGKVVAVDPDSRVLERLRRRAAAAGLGTEIAIECGEIDDVGLPAGSFDLVWTEGTIRFLGFAGVLVIARRLLRPGGFVVLHDDLIDEERKRSLVAEGGFDFVADFALPESAWWDEYYAPLGRRLGAFFAAAGDDPAARRALKAKRAEAMAVEKDPGAFRSFFVVARKKQE